MARALLTTIYAQRACQEAFQGKHPGTRSVLGAQCNALGEHEGGTRPRAEYSILGRDASQSEWSESLFRPLISSGWGHLGPRARRGRFSDWSKIARQVGGAGARRCVDVSGAARGRRLDVSALHGLTVGRRSVRRTTRSEARRSSTSRRASCAYTCSTIARGRMTSSVVTVAIGSLGAGSADA